MRPLTIWGRWHRNLVAQVIMPNRSRPKYAGVQPTPEEANEAITGYLAYFGTHTVDGRVRTITHDRRPTSIPDRSATMVCGHMCSERAIE